MGAINVLYFFLPPTFIWTSWSCYYSGVTVKNHAKTWGQPVSEQRFELGKHPPPGIQGGRGVNHRMASRELVKRRWRLTAEGTTLTAELKTGRTTEIKTAGLKQTNFFISFQFFCPWNRFRWIKIPLQIAGSSNYWTQKGKSNVMRHLVAIWNTVLAVSSFWKAKQYRRSQRVSVNKTDLRL